MKQDPAPREVHDAAVAALKRLLRTCAANDLLNNARRTVERGERLTMAVCDHLQAMDRGERPVLPDMHRHITRRNRIASSVRAKSATFQARAGGEL